VLNAGVPAADRSIEQTGLEAKGLACRRGARLLIAAIDWRLAPGDALLLKGANGSGKSSLLRLLAGFLRPAAGILMHAGANVFSDLPGWRSHLHFITYSDSLKIGLNVGENLQSVASLLGGDGSRQDRALERFGLEDIVDQPARFLSSGQRRRLALARLIAVERPIWLLDEPGTGLDVRNRGRLGSTIDEHRRSGGIVLVASHGDVELDDAFVLDLGG
jgi:heme exporter protein A